VWTGSHIGEYPKAGFYLTHILAQGIRRRADVAEMFENQIFYLCHILHSNILIAKAKVPHI
jgi:hypothetical protein